MSTNVIYKDFGKEIKIGVSTSHLIWLIIFLEMYPYSVVSLPLWKMLFLFQPSSRHRTNGYLFWG
jgi:hypothetical protein